MKPTMIMAGGQQIATYDSGGDGTAVFFLHGNSASSLTFQAQLEGDFGKKYRAVAMDLPGHGESEVISVSECRAAAQSVRDL